MADIKILAAPLTTPAMTRQSLSSHEMPSPVALDESADESASMIRVEWVESIEELEPIIPEWDLLRDRSDSVTSNNDSKRYLDTIAGMAGAATPFVGVFRREGSVCGLIIARRSWRRIPIRVGYLPLRTPMARCVDVVYGGLLFDDDLSLRRVMARELHSLLTDGAWDHVLINKLPLEHKMFNPIASMPGAVLQERRPHWVLKLVPGSFEKMMEQHSGKTRRRLRNEDRKIQNAFDNDVEYRTLTHIDDLDWVFETASSIAKRTYHANLGTVFGDTQLWRNLLTPHAKRGLLRAHFLIGAGQPIAFLIGANEGDRLVYHAIGHLSERSRLSPGKHLMLHSFKVACDDGMRWADFGFGDAEYKRVFASQNKEEASIHLYGRGIRARTTRALDRAAVAVSKVLKRLSNDQASQRLRRVWRQRLTPHRRNAES